MEDADVAAVAELLDGVVKGVKLRVARVHGYGHVDLAGRDEVDRDLVLVEDGEDARQKGVGDGPLVGVDVDDGDLVLDGDGRGALRLLAPRRVRRLPWSLNLLVCREEGVRLVRSALCNLA